MYLFKLSHFLVLDFPYLLQLYNRAFLNVLHNPVVLQWVETLINKITSYYCLQ